jgi:photosystem II stability/assembly factor-like uncharacterized protein
VVDPVTPGVLWVATDGGGVFRSTDRSATWAPHPGGLEAVSLLSLVVDPEDPTQLYAGSSGRGAFGLGAEPAPQPDPRRPRGRLAP